MSETFLALAVVLRSTVSLQCGYTVSPENSHVLLRVTILGGSGLKPQRSVTQTFIEFVIGGLSRGKNDAR